MPNRFVRKLRGFADLTQRDVKVLVEATSRARPYPAKFDLIREGDEPGPVIAVLAGWAFRYKILPSGTRQIMAFLMPGDACDLNIGLLAEMDHSIQTLTPATIAMVPRAEMVAILDSYPRIARAMYIAQLVDEGTLRAWIVSMGRRSSIERVAHLMCELFIRVHAIDGLSDEGLHLPMSQVMLADALGMTPVHINRVLKHLRDARALKMVRGAVTISDPSNLVRIAGFDENYLHRRLRTAA
jgi:CRP-like cAMP-binding protein